MDIIVSWNTPISRTWLPSRVRGVLMKRGIKTMADLTEMSELDILSIPDIGRGSLRWITELCERSGLQLKPLSGNVSIGYAAKSLTEQVQLSDRGLVGVGKDKIFVYLYRRERTRDLPQEWLGYPIVWRSGVGRATHR